MSPPSLPLSPSHRKQLYQQTRHMAASMTGLNDNTPVFCTAEIPDDLLNAFFREAYSAPELADEGIDDVGRYLQRYSRPGRQRQWTLDILLTSRRLQGSSSTQKTSQPSPTPQNSQSPHRLRSPSWTSRPKKSGSLPGGMCDHPSSMRHLPSLTGEPERTGRLVC